NVGEDQESLHDQILGYIEDEVRGIAALHAPTEGENEEYHELVNEFSKLIPFDHASQQQLVKTLTTADDLEETLIKIALDAYESREKALGEEHLSTLERLVTLSTIDEKWMDHLDAMDSLREGIWLRGDKKTVLSEYKKEGFAMFEDLINSIQSTIANKLFRVQLRGVQQKVENAPQKQAVEQKAESSSNLAAAVSNVEATVQRKAPQTTQGSLGDLASALGSAKATKKATPGVKKAKIKRNDPCPCGSGLKYKKCGLIDAPEHHG
ncbi:SEC-C domain-containing protein, partial [Candidatus Woesebacteria bacterium]|nr:SEC-C domain-containing protein [Candidatus Woesebacteria bacterium]